MIESDSNSSDTQHVLKRLSLGHSTSPFPSPGSSFIPPPVHSSHEYANKPSWIKNVVTGSPAINGSPAKKSPPQSSATSPTDTQSSKQRPNGNAAIGVDTTSQSSSGPLSAQSPSSQLSTPTQTLTVTTAFNTSNLTPSTPSFSHRSSSSASLSIGDLSASRIAPPSPAPSRRSSTRRRSRGGGSSISGLALTPTKTKYSPSREIKIRDFAFPAGDARHVGAGAPPPETPDSRRSSAGGWSGFRWNQIASKFSSWASPTTEKSQSQAMPSQSDFDRNFTDTAEDADQQDIGDEEYYDDDGDADMDEELRPGWYRALYAFEPEGTAEMALREDQRVRVLGRGGGVGWAVVRGLGGCALVPESYLEFVGPFAPGEEEDEEEDDNDNESELMRHSKMDVDANASPPKLDGTPKKDSRPLP